MLISAAVIAAAIGCIRPPEKRAGSAYNIPADKRLAGELFRALPLLYGKQDDISKGGSRMVIILKPGASRQEISDLAKSMEDRGITVHYSKGSDLTILGLVGDTSSVDAAGLEANPAVERIVRVMEPYKKANRMFHPDDTVIDVCGHPVGGKQLTVIAGPCSVESSAQIIAIARDVRDSGAHMLRGGAFKPRTSPYSFQGLKYDGLSLLTEAREQTGLPIVTEITSPQDIEVFQSTADVIQVGARNMQNFDLLRELGKVDKPVLLKRGLSATIEEWLMSAEHIMAGGNNRVILCERGIRTFETYTRNTLDLGAIPAVKKLSHLPVLVDPSHATGKAWMVAPMALAAIAAGADGLMIEVHNDPAHALSDGQQSIKPDAFAGIMVQLRPIALAVGREL
jgi:3-deoxy-7-phosphoheptulonate synthase